MSAASGDSTGSPEDSERWAALCERLGCGEARPHFDALRKAYAERHRRYHTLEHVRECIDVLDEVRHLARYPDEIEFALWLHDVVYATGRGDNEVKSAELAATWLRECGVESDVAERIRGLILATLHEAAPASSDQALMQDIDLNVLAAPRERYDEYEAQIRKEYRWVPRGVFRRRRAEILDSFLAREFIFNTAWLRDRFEAAARSNLARAIASLRGTA